MAQSILGCPAFSWELTASVNLIDFFPLERSIPDEQAYARHHDGCD
jgi:hypothetical protein